MKYTSFAIAVIESIWPHPNGYDYIGAPGPNEDREKPIYGVHSKDVVGQTFHEESVEPSGWYKIVPLNIISFKTQASTAEGNKWSVTFTADDMLLVQTGDNQALEGNALIADILDSLREADKSGGSITVTDLLSKGTLSSMPFASRRVSLKDNLFNIQDVAVPGDTVSIWYYNDPAEFFPFELVQNKMKGTSDVSLDFYEVIGSGDRRGQFKTNDDQYASEFKLGLPNHLYARAINAAKTGKELKDLTRGEVDLMAMVTMEEAGRVVEIGGANVKALVSAAEAKVNNTEFLGATTRNPGGLFADQLAWFLSNQYPQEFSGYTSIYNPSPDDLATKKAADSRYNSYATPSDKWGRDSGIQYDNTNSTRTAIQYYIISLFKDAAHLQGATEGEVKANANAVQEVFTAKATVIQDKSLEANPTRPQELEPTYKFDPNLYLAGRTAFANMVKEKVKEAAKVMSGDTTVAHSFSSNSLIKRKVLSNKSFGENSYLVMKGHIQGISTSRTANSQTITVNGSGLEYPLEKHLIFFDTMIDVMSSNGYLQDYRNGSMASMNPAQQMLFLLTKYAPKQVRWGQVSSNDNISRKYMGIDNPASPLYNLVPKEAVERKEVLKRGNLILDRDPALGLDETGTINSKPQKEGKSAKEILPFARVFTPLTHYSQYRLGESLRSFLSADPSGELGNTAFPHTIEDRTPVLQMIKQIAGAQNIMEFFVDSNGYMIYRVAGEAWERTPRPEFTPTVDEDVLVSFNYSESDDNIVTLVDVTMQQMSGMGNATNASTAYHFGRAIARVAPLPINMSSVPAYTRMNEMKNTLSPELFRYGLRYQGLTDVYGGTTNSARDKANTIYRFYGAPVKRAEVTVIGNSSYRAGDTVLVTLPSHKKRTKKRMTVGTLGTWLQRIKESPVHTQMYVGDEGRLKNPGYYGNKGFSLGSINLKHLSKGEVLDHMIRTVQWMKEAIGDNTPITWDLFPTTLWYFLADDSIQDAKEIRLAYKYVLQASVNRSMTLSATEIALIQKHLPKLRFNNFMCMSFYIDGVSHSYEFNSASTTTLNLSYGQENICLINPDAGVTVGFFSVDRRVRDLFPGSLEDFEIQKDGMWRKLFVAQFQEDLKYKAGSFVYQSSEVRNTSNYLHTIAERFGKVLDDNY